ncbi:MUTS [Enterospora canceri]|uniref:MUTS n=1 Tax=Enterospora canceri TaxID=1081671 RepID=A0A1Y1S702_9MICR|nr:MUTS [Enterospora canceri]
MKYKFVICLCMTKYIGVAIRDNTNELFVVYLNQVYKVIKQEQITDIDANQLKCTILFVNSRLYKILNNRNMGFTCKVVVSEFDFNDIYASMTEIICDFRCPITTGNYRSDPDTDIGFFNHNNCIFSKMKLVRTIVGKHLLQDNLKNIITDADHTLNRRAIALKLHNSKEESFKIRNILDEMPFLHKIITSGVFSDESTTNTNTSEENPLSLNASMSLTEYGSISFFILNITSMVYGCISLNSLLEELHIETIYQNELVKLQECLYKLIKPDFIPNEKRIYENNIVNMVQPGINDYLDLAVKIYKENTRELDAFLTDKTSQFNLEVFRFPDSKAIGKLSHCYFKQNKTVENTFKINLDAFKIHKQNKQYALYRCSELDLINCKIEHTLDQIIELVGKHCYSLIENHRKHLSFISDAIQKVAELDVCYAINKFNEKYQTHQFVATKSNTISIHDTQPIFIQQEKINTIRTSYTFKRPFVAITGPNGIGKSTYCTNLAQQSILNSLGAGIPASDNSSIPQFNQIIHYNSTRSVPTNITNSTLILVDEVSIPSTTLIKLFKSNAHVFFITHNLNTLVDLNPNMRFITLSHYQPVQYSTKTHPEQELFKIIDKYLDKEFTALIRKIYYKNSPNNE